ncbi:unnamed protein product [Effrenium voratum]|nr:unnamed protein product [Effrenium voratum]
MANVAQALESQVLVASFLTRHELSVEKAVEAMQRTISWRKESGASEARKQLLAKPEMRFADFPFGSEVLNFLPQCEGGLAIEKRGLPYALRCTGLADAVGLFEQITEDNLMLFQMYLNEWRLLQLEHHAHETGQLCGVLMVQDMFAPAGLLNVWRKQHQKAAVMRRVTSMMDEHYPGLMETVLLANAPWVLNALMKLVTPLMPPRVVKKVQVVSVPETAEKLLEYIGPEHLPCFLGGLGKNEDFVAARAALLTAPGADLFVKAGGVEEQRLQLEQGEVAVFGFNVGADLDILFSCCFLPEGGLPQDVVASVRVKDTGSTFTAWCRGCLVLSFDNTYSWVKSKTIRFELMKMPEAEEPIGTPGAKPIDAETAEPTETETETSVTSDSSPEREAKSEEELAKKRSELQQLEEQREQQLRQQEEESKLREIQAEQAAQEAARQAEEARQRQSELEKRQAEIQQLEAQQEEAARQRWEEEQRRAKELQELQQALQHEREALQQQREEQKQAHEKALEEHTSRASDLEEQQAQLEAQRQEVQHCQARGEAEREAKLEQLREHEEELQRHREELAQQRREEEELRKAQADTFQLLDQELQDRAQNISSSEEALAAERKEILRSRGQLAMVQAHVLCSLNKAYEPNSTTMHILDPDEPEAEMDAPDMCEGDGEDVYNMDWAAVTARRSEKSDA